jgi:iron complex outermembrane recepter protein
MSRNFRASLAYAATAMGLVLSAPALAQSADDESHAGDIIVTAQRVEQRLQDVPISITVYNQEQLQNRNVAVASDLATYTPSLSVNTRFGPEKSTFAIRGFNQDAAAAPTVGVYFADVVGVRSQGGTASGNTVGAGSFTDLQNVQVLKGPQGTLFGRNTTGGAVLLVPARPTDSLEGYVEGTYGNYDQTRLQAALNLPVADTFKVRLSLDRNKRDGYMRNMSGIGPKAYNDVDYVYGRLSILVDLTPDLENYTIVHYSKSDTFGYANHFEACDPDTPSPFVGGSLTRYYTSLSACDQIARAKARGDGPLSVDVANPDPSILIETWQAINTTTLRASDTITVKNIISYGEYRERAAFSLYSDNFFVPNTAVTQFFAGRGGPLPGQRYQYITLDNQPGFDAAAESTLTEELQIQGRSADNKFNYVIGGYLEFSRPIGFNQQRTGIFGNCADPGTLQCVGGLPLVPLSASVTAAGALVSESRTRMSFDNHGIYAQGTYNFTDQLALTLGGRWTFDTIDGYAESNRWTFATIPMVGTIPVARSCNDSLNHPTVNLLTNGGDTSACGTRIKTKTNKPTWLVNLDYKPNGDTLLYAKWSRGYRQGAVNFTNPGLETVGPEKVDAYELGAKMSFRGAVPGYINLAAFYNDFTDQQIFGALIAKPNSGLAGGAALINAGRSVIKGLEIDGGVTVVDVLRLSAGYTYLSTKLKELVAPTLDPNSPFQQIIPRGVLGGPLTYSPKHKLTLGADLNVPMGADAGAFTAGAVFVHTSSQFVDGNRKIPGYSLLSLNAGVENIGGSTVSIVAFANNVTNRKYRVTSGGGFESSGILDFAYGQPRMYGVRMKVRFGN